MSMIGSQATAPDQPAQKLNDNVKKLREQLTNIHKLLNQAQNATEISFEERRDKEAASDISVMAVQQVKTQYKSENERLRAENDSLVEQVRDLNDTKIRLQRELTDARHTSETSLAELEELKQNYETLKKNYKMIYDENEATQNKYKLESEKAKSEIVAYTKQIDQQR